MASKEMENKKRIWKDKGAREKFILILVLSLVIVFILLMKLSEGSLNKIFFLGLTFLGIVALLSQFTRKITAMYNSGILIGNITAKNWHKLFLEKRKFVYWEDIKEIKIINKEISVPKARTLQTFLNIKSRNENYESLIIDIEGFIQALKELNKIYLLDKKSLENYNTK